MRRCSGPLLVCGLAVICLLAMTGGRSDLAAQQGPGNRPERLEWFRDLGFGLFIHWSLDSQVGSVISHSLVGASDDYVKKFFDDLPRSFDPVKFAPQQWARLARLAGFRYMVFTTKHHSGFCMYDSKTTAFNIMNTPYGKDITAQLMEAFRKEGIATGVYFSPDDFHFLHEQGTLISRRRPEVFPVNNPGLMKHDQAQLRELMSNYGPVEVVFIDGPAEGLRDVCWELQPNTVVTRGAIETPEQYTPGIPLEGAWEGNLTMGQQWQYRPTNETYKSGTELIDTLIETRAKGGNLLLNIGPKPDGELPIEQEGRLREIALWNMVNGESIYAVRPWVITNEENIWFTKAKDANTVYAFVTGANWLWGEPMTFWLKSVKATEKTVVSVLGQNDKVLEYHPETVPATKWEQTANGLRITAVRAQRLYNDRRWPNPVVLKITNAEAGLIPPVVLTSEARWDAARRQATVEGELVRLGDAKSVDVTFQYRRRKHDAELYEQDDPWKDLKAQSESGPARFSMEISGLKPGQSYDYRAVVRHPAVTLYGATKSFAAQ
jgi:alpha-L-fucosidase